MLPPFLYNLFLLCLFSCLVKVICFFKLIMINWVKQSAAELIIRNCLEPLLLPPVIDSHLDICIFRSSDCRK